MLSHPPMFATSGMADCPYSIALEHAAGYFKRFDCAADDVFVTFPYRALGLPMSGGLQRRVKLSFHISEDSDDRSRSHEALSFKWDAGARYLPNLHGVLNFRIAGDGLTEVMLQYGYTPPLGTAGAIFDRVVGRYIARVTGHVLLERIIGEIETQERAFRKTLDPSETTSPIDNPSISGRTTATV